MALEITRLNPNYEKLIKGSKNYDPLYEEIYTKFSDLSGETSQRITRNLEDKRFYLGDPAEHVGHDIGLDDIPHIVNYSAAVINKYADLLTAGDMPGIQVIAPSEDAKLKAFASAAENLLYRILETNFFARKLHYGAVNGSMLGDSFFHVYWDPDKEVSGVKGAVVLETLSPFFVRVGFAQDNWDDIEYWMVESRMSPTMVKAKWGIEAAVTNISTKLGASGSTTNSPFDNTPVESDKTYVPMVTIVEYHDKEKDAVLVGDTAIFLKSNKGNHGLFHIRNRTAPNEPWGYPDHYNIKDPNRILNRLYEQAEEIIDSHAAPIIVDKGNVLGGRKLKTRHNVVVTTSEWLPGMGLEYLQWGGNIYPIDQQIEDTTKVIHDLSEMPAAAFGSYQPGTQSGFALSIQMQPTLMRVKIKQNAEWGPNLVEMYHYILQLVLGNQKGINLPKKVADFEIRLTWPNPLPREDAREIQNNVALVTNKLISKETARQELLIEDVIIEANRIDNETMREAQVQADAQATMMQSQMQAQAQAQAQAQGQVQGQGETALNTPIQPGQAAEQAFPKLQEEQRPTPQNLGLEGGQSIAPTSTEVPK